MIIGMIEKKICKKCGIEKKLCEFNKDKYAKDGLRYRCRSCTQDEYKKFYYENLEKEINRQINYQKNNIDSVRKRRNKKHNEKYYTDILYKLKVNVRNRVKMYLKSKNSNLKETKGTFKLVGCSPQELREHLQKQFKEGMSWENYRHDIWHIDHIIPLSSAKTEEEVYELCNYTNLQPLWKEENYKKGKKIL
jgi:hypothetical protein